VVLNAVSLAAAGRSAIQPTSAAASYLDPPGNSPATICPGGNLHQPSVPMPTPEQVVQHVSFFNQLDLDPLPAGVVPHLSAQQAWDDLKAGPYSTGSRSNLLLLGYVRQPSALNDSPTYGPRLRSWPGPGTNVTSGGARAPTSTA